MQHILQSELLEKANLHQCQRTWIEMVWNLVVLKQNLTTSLWSLWPVRPWILIPSRLNSLALAEGKRSRRNAIYKQFNSELGKNEITSVWLIVMSKTLTRDDMTKTLTSLCYLTSSWHYWILIVSRGPACSELSAWGIDMHFRKRKPFCVDAKKQSLFDSNICSHTHRNTLNWYHPYQ